MNKNKKKLYVGCAINNLSPEDKRRFLGQIASLKDSLRNHFEVLDFVGDASAPVEAIYTHDIHNCVGQADCMLAICDHPSTGMGYELGTAIEKHDIPVLAVAHKDSSVTRLLQGVTSKKFKFQRYGDWSEIAPLTIGFLG